MRQCATITIGDVMKKKISVCENSMVLVYILAMSGGFMDAYSYMCRGEVFANAQTGNIVLMGCHLISKNLKDSIRYFLPVAFFALGILMACLIRSRFRRTGRIHWRHLVLTIEIILLCLHRRFIISSRAEHSTDGR